jgi:glutathione S-transferase
MLEEIGEPYELVVLDLKQGDQRKPAHLAVNPMGKVPALVHNGALVTEAGAICTYLADAFPKAGLAPAIGDPLRGPYLRWMFFQGNCLEPAVVDRALKREPGPPMMMPYGDFDTMADTLAAAVRTGPWFLGERYTTLDVYLGSAIRWTMGFKLLPERPEFLAYVARLDERPAYKRAKATDDALVAQQTAGT